MNSREMQRVASHSRDIIFRYLNEAPVRLGALAAELGIAAIKVTAMNSGVSGQIQLEDNKYVIRINRNEARERQRFTIAHEIAHFLLHRPIIDASTEGITDTVLYRSGAPAQVEFEANRLAADLVMPRQLLHSILAVEYGGQISDTTIECLAARFGVSKAAMQIRLETLTGA